MNNIGCVVYSKTTKNLNAFWFYSNNNKVISGTGIGVRTDEGNIESRFDGQYNITYFDEDGTELSTLKLIISFKSGYYDLKWIKDDKISYYGLGLEIDNKLSAGWYKVD